MFFFFLICSSHFIFYGALYSFFLICLSLLLPLGFPKLARDLSRRTSLSERWSLHRATTTTTTTISRSFPAPLTPLDNNSLRITLSSSPSSRNPRPSLFCRYAVMILVKVFFSVPFNLFTVNPICYWFCVATFFSFLLYVYGLCFQFSASFYWLLLM